MAFTFKAYQAGRKARATAGVASDKAQSTAAATVKAGPKNSNGPTGGSSKSSVPANRTYLKTNNKGAPGKVAKVTKASLNPVKGGSNQASTKMRSTRVNYRQLKKSK